MGKNFYLACRRECPRRSLDVARIHKYLELNGWKPSNAKKADLILVYTCGGLQSYEDRSVKTINELQKKKKKNSEIIVTGCLTKINPKVIDGPFKVVDPKNLNDLDKLISAKAHFTEVRDQNLVPRINDLVKDSIGQRFLDNFQLNPSFIKKSLTYAKKSILGENGAIESGIYNLKIAHGCLGDCSYCAIRLATGKLKSKPNNEIKKEFEHGLRLGYKRFVLIAEDTGCYGVDIGSSIVELLETLFSTEGEFKIIINDFNPRWLVKYHDKLLPLFKRYQAKIEDFRVPIQSGSDRILKLMRRHYKAAAVIRCLKGLKKTVPKLRIETHILLGFPGETEEDFMQTKKLLKEVDFDYISIYCYESRKGTPAAKMKQTDTRAMMRNKVRRL